MDKLDFTYFLSIYAALLSTLAIGWRLYEFYYENRGRFDIKIQDIHKTPLTNFKMGDGKNFLVIKITNTSNKQRYIKEPSFISNMINKKYFNVLKFDKTISYPLPLSPGETHEYPIEKEELKEQLKQHNISKIRVLLQDSFNKKYFSKWFKI